MRWAIGMYADVRSFVVTHYGTLWTRTYCQGAKSILFKGFLSRRSRKNYMGLLHAPIGDQVSEDAKVDNGRGNIKTTSNLNTWWKCWKI